MVVALCYTEVRSFGRIMFSMLISNFKNCMCMKQETFLFTFCSMYASRYKFVSPLGYLSFAMRAIVSRSIVWQYKIWTFCFDVILHLLYIPSHIFILLGCFIDKIYRSNAFRFFTQLDRQNACYENTKSCWSIVIPVGKEKNREKWQIHFISFFHLFLSCKYICYQ